MRDGLLRRFNHLVDDVFGRGSVGVAHAEVDDVFSAAAGGNLHLPRDVEDIRRKALNAAELFHGNSVQFTVLSSQSLALFFGRLGQVAYMEADHSELEAEAGEGED